MDGFLEDGLSLQLQLAELEHRYVALGLAARAACEHAGVEFDPATWVISEMIRAAYAHGVEPEFLIDWFEQQEGHFVEQTVAALERA